MFGLVDYFQRTHTYSLYLLYKNNLKANRTKQGEKIQDLGLHKPKPKQNERSGSVEGYAASVAAQGTSISIRKKLNKEFFF